MAGGGREMGVSPLAKLRLINLLKYLKKHNLPLMYMRSLWSSLFLLLPWLRPYSLHNNDLGQPMSKVHQPITNSSTLSENASAWAIMANDTTSNHVFSDLQVSPLRAEAKLSFHPPYKWRWDGRPCEWPLHTHRAHSKYGRNAPYKFIIPASMDDKYPSPYASPAIYMWRRNFKDEMELGRKESRIGGAEEVLLDEAALRRVERQHIGELHSCVRTCIHLFIQQTFKCLLPAGVGYSLCWALC